MKKCELLFVAASLKVGGGKIIDEKFSDSNYFCGKFGKFSKFEIYLCQKFRREVIRQLKVQSNKKSLENLRFYL